MAILTPLPVPVDGGVALESSAVAATAGGDEAPVGGGRFLYVANGDTVAHTATLATPGEVSGFPVEDAQLTVGAGESGIIPLTGVFRGPEGRASITYDAVTSVTVAVFALGH